MQQSKTLNVYELVILNLNRGRKTTANNSNAMSKRRYSTYRVRDQTIEFESTKRNYIPTGNMDPRNQIQAPVIPPGDGQ